MLCLACNKATRGRICEACERSLRRAPDRVLPGGVSVYAAFLHERAARRLIHQLKYQGLHSFAEIVAETLAPRLPTLPLVPVPRATSRKWRYGVDPALLIARALGERTGAPVLSVLRPPIHSQRRAGGNHDRAVPDFALRTEQVPCSIVVDDVVTTGRTALAAVRSLQPAGVHCVVAANVVPEVSSLSAQ